MLVLNTSKEWWSRMSNDFLSWYPDFDSILIHPSGVNHTNMNLSHYKSWPQTITLTPETLSKKIYSVNWTAINIKSNTLYKDLIYSKDLWVRNSIIFFENANFNIFGQSSSVFSTYHSDFTRICKMRIWMLEDLEAGMIVGKKIKTNACLLHSIEANNNYYYTSKFTNTCKISFDVGILRSDGSIQSIGTIPIIDDTERDIRTSSNSINIWNSNIYVEKQFSWVVTNDWDKIVVDVNLHYNLKFTPLSANSSNSWGKVSLWLLFWKNAYPNSISWAPWSFQLDIDPRPIQISVE